MMMRRHYPPHLTIAAALCLFCVGLATLGCSDKPPQTTPPGSEHVSGEKLDEQGADTVHTSNGSAPNSAGAQPAGDR
ncbi:MAG TPA: hypothetical protein VKU00_13190 [Chthonomonadaceae bacterium]|nr:hypothetical protein [Chthonomonadaceae bacterium]